MESILKFISENTILTICIFVCVFILVMVLVFKGFSFETKSGNKIKIGGITKNKDVPKTKEEELKNYMLITILVNSWNKKLFVKLDKLKSGIINDCIRHAVGVISGSVNNVKQRYMELANEKDRLNAPESNYQTTIFNLLMDNACENMKDYICSVIREDHFNSKTKEELEQVGDRCVSKIDEGLYEVVTFNRDLLSELRKEKASDIKNMASDIVAVSIKKYDILKEKKKELIEEAQADIRNELKSKFDFMLSDCDLETLTEYEEE